MSNKTITLSGARIASMLVLSAVAGLLLAIRPAVSAVSADSLIKSPSSTAVYYLAEDGQRYVFPNERTYFSWYQDFSRVLTISAAELAAIPIGGNVTYRPGVKLVKITTDPKVYAVSRYGELRWLASETVAVALYGPDWSRQVEDVPDAFFVNYSIGQPITNAADYSPTDAKASALTPNDSLRAPATPTGSSGTAGSTGPNGSNGSVGSSSSSGSTGPGGSSQTGSTLTSADLPYLHSPLTTPSVSVPANGHTYYVATDGSDANDGSSATPWRSPAYGAGQLRPGDTLVIRAGRYVLSDYSDDILRPGSGTAAAWVTIKGDEGTRPVLAGRDNLAAAIDIAGADYLKIENLEITSDDGADFRDGIMLLGSPSEHVVLQNLHIHHLDEFGVNAQDVSDFRMIGMKITHCGFGAAGGPDADQGGWRDVLIQDSDLSYSGWYYQGHYEPGYSPYERPDGFGNEPSDGPIEFRRVTITHNIGDGLDSKSRNTRIYQSIIANNRCDGLKLWGGGSRAENVLIYGRGDGQTGSTPWASIVAESDRAGASFEFVNVTVDDSGTYSHRHALMYFQYDRPTVPMTVTFRNSVFRSLTEGQPVFFQTPVSWRFDNSLLHFPNRPDDIVIHGGVAEYAREDLASFGNGNRLADPMFVDPAVGRDGDYRLATNSPAIGLADPAYAPAIDLAGTARPQGIAPDAGALESQP